MKKTMVIDDELLAKARAACGASTDTATVHEGLQALVKRRAHEDLRALLGTEQGPVVDVPRRREPVMKRTRRA
jgi:Arc/MetJ family transcription regulator